DRGARRAVGVAAETRRRQSPCRAGDGGGGAAALPRRCRGRRDRHCRTIWGHADETRRTRLSGGAPPRPGGGCRAPPLPRRPPRRPAGIRRGRLGPPSAPAPVIDRVFGVDFSGGEAAGDSIWIAEARIDGRRIRVESCRSAALLPGSGRKRAQCLEALVDFIAARRNSVVGCDFPFSLPSSMIDARDWRAFALDFADRFGTADDFLGDCRRRGNGRERRRDCARESRVPFAAYTLRISRQTYHGTRDFLAPLVRDRRAVVLPMERPQGALPWVIE